MRVIESAIRECVLPGEWAGGGGEQMNCGLERRGDGAPGSLLLSRRYPSIVSPVRSLWRRRGAGGAGGAGGKSHARSKEEKEQNGEMLPST